MMEKSILHTKGAIKQFGLDIEGREVWEKAYAMMDEEEAYVIPSQANDGKYVFLGLINEEKNKELAYQMEQDPMTGVYIDDRKRFDVDWDNEEYEPDGCFYLCPENVEIIKEN